MKNLTRQQIFETAARGLLRQGKKSQIAPPRPGCAYRGQGGTKCAIGHLIPDDVWDSRPNCIVNNASVYDLREEGFLRRCRLPDSIDGIGFLINLQEVHDAYVPREWKERLRKFSLDYDLDASFIDKEGL